MNDTNSKVSENRQKKEVIVQELLEKVEKARGIVFTNYQGLTHQQIETLKKALKPLEAEFVNTKNTLLKIALVQGQKSKDSLISELTAPTFQQPTATLFMYNDIILPLKQLTKLIKELKLPAIKFGFLEGKLLNEQEIIKASTLAPLPVLRAQLLGQMQAPISGLHRALSWNLQKLVLTLSAVKEKKG